MKIIILLTSLLWFTGLAAKTKTLQEFELELAEASPILLAADDLAVSQLQLDKIQANNGWKLFGGIGSGQVRSIVDRGRTYDYTALLGNIGARHPLLGSAEKEDQLFLRAEQEVAVKNLDLEWAKRKLGIQLANDYANYWGAQQKLQMTQKFVAFREKAAQILAARTAQGLLLKSDQLEAMTGFERVQYENLENQQNLQNILEAMSAYLGRPVSEFDAVQPALNSVDNNQLNQDILNHHDLAIISAMLAAQNELIEHNQWRGIESDAVITQSVTLNDPVTDVGHGFIAGVNVQIPLGLANYRDAEQKHANLLVKKLQNEYQLKQRQLQASFESTVRKYQRVNELLNYQQSRLTAVAELIRERELRLQSLDGDVIEKYLQALYDYQRVVTDYLDAQTERWHTLISLSEFNVSLSANSLASVDLQSLVIPFSHAETLLHLVPTGEHLPHPSSVVAGLGVYLWDSSAVLNSNQDVFWQRINTQKVQRVLLSLNQNQIELYSQQPQQLQQFLHKAQAQQVRVALLLGEASWILPKHRHKLINIIKALRGFEFEQIHLDIEINQLTGYPDSKLLRYWLETLQVVVKASPWPVAISTHSRYLQKNQAGYECIVCSMASFGIAEISVMNYVSNIEKSLNLLNNYAHDYPQIKFALAQSIEPQLGTENSFAHLPKDRFLANLAKLQQNLQQHANFTGIIIQSWQDLEKYWYENKI